MDTPATIAAARGAAPPGADAVVDEDFAAALAGLGARAVGAVRITGLPSSRSDRATLRVVLDDGRTVKTRRLSRAAKAQRYVRLARALALEGLSPILAVRGRVCIEEWIEGERLAERLPPERLAAAADLLGSVHATRTLEGRNVAGVRATARLLQQSERRIGLLAARGALAPAVASALARRLRRTAPARARTGVTHNDFCAENLVEDARGRLFAVDNESLRLDFLDFDLARTWARWPMPPADWSVFLARYAGWRDEPIDPAAAPFWRIAAIAKSAHLRTRRETVRSDVPLRLLHELAASD